MKKDRAFCCFIDPVTGDCPKDAKWNIWTTGAPPDIVTQACDDHVGHLLELGWSEVWPADQDRAEKADAALADEPEVVP